jgi:hypothetical protein
MQIKFEEIIKNRELWFGDINLMQYPFRLVYKNDYYEVNGIVFDKKILKVTNVAGVNLDLSFESLSESKIELEEEDYSYIKELHFLE